jgi:hypothetical protein
VAPEEVAAAVPAMPAAPRTDQVGLGWIGLRWIVAQQETIEANNFQEAVDSFPTAKLTKLDELISNPR